MTCCRRVTWDLLSGVLESRSGVYWILGVDSICGVHLHGRLPCRVGTCEELQEHSPAVRCQHIVGGSSI
jgi:hypothetical protein